MWSYIELLFIAIALAMDSFAVSITLGLSLKSMKFKVLNVTALWFAVFQAGMPLIGFWLGSVFSKQIQSFDHWVAFMLLLFIGGKMLFEGLSSDEADDTERVIDATNKKRLTTLAFATSIDALAVGISFALISLHPIWFSVSIIGLITYLFVLLGLFIGHKFGKVFQDKAEIIGGVILVLIGVKILLEHLL